MEEAEESIQQGSRFRDLSAFAPFCSWGTARMSVKTVELAVRADLWTGKRWPSELTSVKSESGDENRSDPDMARRTGEWGLEGDGRQRVRWEDCGAKLTNSTPDEVSSDLPLFLRESSAIVQ